MALRGAIDWVMEQPWVYRLWQAPFAESKFSPVQRQLNGRIVRRVLDVGCGPGTNASRFLGTEYVGLDINEQYLKVGRARHQGQFIHADLATADLSHLGRFDTILVNSFLHHLPDDAVERVLEGTAQLLEPNGRVHILELVLPDTTNLATLMARFDRGRHARSIEAWKALFERHFEPVALEEFVLGGWLWAMVYFQGGSRTCGSR